MVAHFRKRPSETSGAQAQGPDAVNEHPPASAFSIAASRPAFASASKPKAACYKYSCNAVRAQRLGCVTWSCTGTLLSAHLLSPVLVHHQPPIRDKGENGSSTAYSQIQAEQRRRRPLRAVLWRRRPRSPTDADKVAARSSGRVVAPGMPSPHLPGVLVSSSCRDACLLDKPAGCKLQ